MKNLTAAVFTGIGFAIVSTAAANAQAPAQKPKAPKSWGKADIDNMCNKPSKTPVPAAGWQYDGNKASSAVMNMSFGKYTYPNGGMMLVWPDERYLIKLPSTRKGIFGTDGDDLLASGGLVGGCSLEQLSEAIARNDLDFGSLKQVKAYR